MSGIFIQIFNLSITAGWIIAAVLVLRLLLKKAPKWLICLLWAMVGVRLVFPFSIESALSLIPSAKPIPADIVTVKNPTIQSGFDAVDKIVNPIISEQFAPVEEASVNPMQIIVELSAYIWAVGIVLMLIYGAVSYIRLAMKVRPSLRYTDNIYYCDDIDTPFILGMFRPKIYLPSGLDVAQMEYVIKHEKAHLFRKDHFWKPLGFAILSVYWFNPMIWAAYIFLCRDIEMACDEKVIKDMDASAKKGYSEALVSCSVHRRTVMACPLAFGEVGVKDRVKSVLSYKKPAFWIIIAAIIACIAVVVCFLTNPPQKDYDTMSPHGVIYTDYEGVYITIKSIDKDEGGQNVFNIVWHNETDEQMIYGESFTIEYRKGSEWIDVSTEEHYFHTLGYMLEPASMKEIAYSEKGFDIFKSGIYRLRSTFSNIDGETYSTWIELAVSQNGVYKAWEGDYSVKKFKNAIQEYSLYFSPIEYSDLKNGKLEIETDFSITSVDVVRVTYVNYYDINAELTSQLKLAVFHEEFDNKTVIGVDWYEENSSLIEARTCSYLVQIKGEEGIEQWYYFRVRYGEKESKALVYDCPIFSYVMSPNALPDFEISDGVLCSVNDGVRSELGTVAEKKLTALNFDSYFQESDGATYYTEPSVLRKQNKKAYELTPYSDVEGIEIYYIMEQKNGETLLVFGHYAEGKKEGFIRWIYSIK